MPSAFSTFRPSVDALPDRRLLEVAHRADDRARSTRWCGRSSGRGRYCATFSNAGHAVDAHGVVRELFAFDELLDADLRDVSHW
jgi:hypothetical protein